jgi:hypothetical protein
MADLGSNSSRVGINQIFINVTGGNIDNLVGGAGQILSYGNRILSVTGGKINYSVFGGSNSYDTGEGEIRGSSLLYIGGNAQIGDEENVASNSKLWGAEAGSVFGVGNGRGTTSTIGTMDNATIIIDGNAHILRNIYGGGNIAAVGVRANITKTNTSIKVLGGTIDGDVFGGGNENGSGDLNTPSTINIEMTGGNVKRQHIWRK